ncbi:cell division control protein 14 [Tulasnella sp. 403]|nr:cell division control protein 14 [Tulasnella sp. 403]
MAPSCEPLIQFSERLYFTTFPHPPPQPNILNNAKTQLHPRVRSKTRYHGPNPTPDEVATYYWFTIDNDLPYMSFFEDWGPLNLGQVYKACILIHELLEDKDLKPHRIVLYSSNDSRKKANAALLMALFVQIVQRRQPWEAFHPIAEVEFMPFRDAGRGRSDFNLSIQDCLFGFWKATQFGLCDLNEFSLEEYEFYEKVENGDWNWITPHFIAFASPVDTMWMKNGGPSQQLANGSASSRAGSTQPQSRAGSQPQTTSSTLQKKLPQPFLNCLEYFSERSVKTIVRLNNPLYDKNTFLERGFEHVELYFDDGTNPTDEIVRRFLDLADRVIESGGVVAVHCKAGLGRTGTLIGAYLIYKYGFTANEAIAFMRIVRPGCVVGPQQASDAPVQQYMYTRQLEWAKWAALDEFRRQQEQEQGRAVSRMGAITPPSDSDEIALNANADAAPSTPKAKRTVVPVTPPPRQQTAAASAAGPGPLEVTQTLPPPGQPRKTPRAQRIRTEMELDENDENEETENAPVLVDEESDEKKAEAEEQKDGLGTLGTTANAPPSPTKGPRGRVVHSKQLRQPPATERIQRTTRSSTRTATVASTARTAATTASNATTLKAKGAAATTKARAATTTGAGAATTSTTSTSYKIPRLANTPSAAASRRPMTAMGTRRAPRPVSPSPGSPHPVPTSRLPVPSGSLIPSKRGYAAALPNGGGPLHAHSDTNTLQVPIRRKTKGRRGSAGSVGSVVSNTTSPGGVIGKDTAELDPDAWMSGEAAGAIVNTANKNERPLLRSVRRRRSSFSAADVIV